MNEALAREEICRVGRSLFERGYVHASAGNISVRLDDGYLITPTDACLGFLDPARLSRLGADGVLLSGDAPSKTLALHMRINQQAAQFDPATRCVLHTHSRHCVAVSLGASAAELLLPLTAYFVIKVGHVPLLQYQRPGSAATVEQVAAAIQEYGLAARPIRAVMLARLGPVVWHDRPAAAMAVLEELEETAALAVLGGAAEPLTELQIGALRQAFGARW